MTNIDIDAIRARANAAADGPWRTGTEMFRLRVTHSAVPRCFVENAAGQRVATCSEADAEFIAAARTDVPALLDLVAEQAAEIRVLNGMVTDAKYTVGQVLTERDAARQETNALTSEIDDRDSEISTLRQDLDFQTKAAFDNQGEASRLRTGAERVVDGYIATAKEANDVGDHDTVETCEVVVMKIRRDILGGAS